MIYSDKGRRRRVICPCPKCRFQLSEVINVGTEDGGETVRQRRCPECGNSWFTAQEPEYVIPADEVAWRNKKPYLRQTVVSLAGGIR